MYFFIASFFISKAFRFENMYIKNFISFLNLGLTGFIWAASGARFISPGTSIEENSLGVIHSAPIHDRRFLLEKFCIFFCPLLWLADMLVITARFTRIDAGTPPPAGFQTLPGLCQC
ncbi:hypothetical protein CSA56_09745 [candidate division KSB3 bacterium]|uniref:Uncharacterized protein n=1 Tax=candidate division KSB3 bacterium TaxID=2044937 RepID=A0A2G6KDR1_9BACT|nr:MAG: hypothetical protein CSA56_09745 [candidate division KSB3 bacterium]